MADFIKKEVFVVFGERRRPVTYTLEERAVCLKKVFGEVLDPVGAFNFYFQVQSMKWSDQLVDVVDSIQNDSTLHIFLHLQRNK